MRSLRRACAPLCGSSRRGVVRYYYAEVDTWHASHPGGGEVYHFPSGQTEAHAPGGRKDILFPDGARRRVHPGGREEDVPPPPPRG
jgi:hypothetical protein